MYLITTQSHLPRTIVSDKTGRTAVLLHQNSSAVLFVAAARLPQLTLHLFHFWMIENVG